MTCTYMPKYLLRIIGIAVILFCSTYSIKAQTFCPSNIDFESGNLNNWELFTGSCCPVNTTNPGQAATRHTIMSGNGVDKFGKFPVVAPAAGKYSLRLGNDRTGAQAERARYHVRVPTGPSKYILLYRYAVVFQDPGHPTNEQPSFNVRAFDSATNVPLSCYQFTYVASSNIPGFIESDVQSRVYYLPWTTGILNLSNYGGQTITLEFESSDCGYGGHFGYGYVDINCGLYKIQAAKCNGSNNITLNGPPGYQSYEWRNSTLTTVLSTQQALTVPAPPTFTTYAVILTPYPGFGCKDTLYTQYTGAVNSTITATTSNDTSTCPGGKVPIKVNAYSLDSPITYRWIPTTGLSCTLCPNPTVTGTSPTNFQVISTNFLGCSDTQSIKVRVDTVVRAKISAPTDTLCGVDSMLLVNTAPNPQGTTKKWIRLGNGGSVIGGNVNSDSVYVKWNNGGLKQVIFQTSINGCSAYDTLNVYISPKYSIAVPNDDTICLGAQKTITTNTTSGSTLIYNWVPNNSLSCNNCPSPIATPQGTTTYTVYSSNGTGCYDTGRITIVVDTATFAEFELEKDSLCLNELMWIKNKGGNTILTNFLWSVDTAGNIITGNGKDSITVLWTSPGTKKIVHTAFEGICSTKDSLTVEVVSSPIAAFEIQSNVCVNDPALMVVTLNDNTIYEWNIDGQNIDDDPQKKEYSFTWPNIGDQHIKLKVSRAPCYDSMERIVSVRELPIAKISYDEGELCLGKKFTLKAQNGQRYTYSWSPPQLFKENNQSIVTGTVERSEYIFLNVRNQWNCESTDTVFISGRNCCEIFVPDAFTPNGDGINDYIRPLGMEDLQLAQFMIVHRNGTILLDTKNQNDKWDGTYNGEIQDLGTYAYFVKYVCNGEEIIKKGTFHLIR